MLESEAIQMIAQVGFPIVMCLWFMFRTEKVMSKVVESLERFSDLMMKMCDKKHL